MVAVRERGGGLVLDVEGDGRDGLVEPLVRMRRLAEEAHLDRMLERDAVTGAHVEALVELLVGFYREAERSPAIDRFGAVETIRGNVEENFEQTRPMGPPFEGPRLDAIRSGQLSYLELHRDVFERRIAEGWIRDCHGDLRAEHVAFVPEPVAIDCIEFADRIRYGDVASDLAFLEMDLEFLGHREVGKKIVAGFRDASGDRSLDRVLDFYVSYRAYVRAKVDAMALEQRRLEPAARKAKERRIARHFDLAYFHTLRFHRARLVLVGGLSGAGKTTLAVGLGERLGAPVLRSDEIRREVAAAVEPEPGFGRGRYAPEVTRRTYAAMAERAGELLEEGATVIADATFSTDEQREFLKAAARDSGVAVVELECRVAADVAAERMERRRAEGRDPSEATPEIQAEQRRRYDSPEDAVSIDTTGPPEEVLRRAIERLARQRNR